MTTAVLFGMAVVTNISEINESPKNQLRETMTEFSCIESEPQKRDPDSLIDYSTEMIKSCVAGDHESAKRYEILRNGKIDRQKLNQRKISYEDMNALAKLINNEAGSSWLPMEWKMKVGEVLLNRVDSAEFPNTIQECISAPGQYDIRNQGKTPTLSDVEAAFKLLSGDRLINDPSVVFQSNFKQGSGVYEVLHDEVLGDTYLCYSNNPELYT